MANLREELLATGDVAILWNEAGIEEVMVVHVLASIPVWITEVIIELFPERFLIAWETIMFYDFDAVLSFFHLARF